MFVHISLHVDHAPPRIHTAVSTELLVMNTHVTEIGLKSVLRNSNPQSDSSITDTLIPRFKEKSTTEKGPHHCDSFEYSGEDGPLFEMAKGE
jgi:hypothetical protein